MKKFKTKYIVYLVLIVITSCLLGLFIKYITGYTEHTYSLSEIEDGTYVIYYKTHSNIPSDNYDVVTLYYGDSIHTFKGSVSITYTNDKPYVYIKKVNIVNSDKIHVYVPKGSVKYEGSVNISR